MLPSGSGGTDGFIQLGLRRHLLLLRRRLGLDRRLSVEDRLLCVFAQTVHLLVGVV